MIGVVATAADMTVVREFFELFKTPWEAYESGRPYDVVLCAGDVQVPHHAAKVIVVYSGHQSDSLPAQGNGRILSYGTASIPIYGEYGCFPHQDSGMLTDQESGKAAAYTERSGDAVVTRIGYDLFAEVRFLLEKGQPVANAGIPTLELHITVLRQLIVENGIPLMEIPPVPAGYHFIASLTHDVDHPSIRRHKWDHTTFGFLYRAILGSLVRVLRGQMSGRDLLSNWLAALKLPLIQLGFARDLWGEFANRYMAFESGVRSTFFIIPFSNRAGRTRDGLAPRFRAAAYGANDIADTVQTLVSAGCEVGLHGIDAWIDDRRACEELEEIRRVTGLPNIGVRMHWLYYSETSPILIEQAGADYDSTVGYNDTIGFRAGTTQAYKPLQAQRLLELPLHIMDTALFYRKHLGLSPRQASAALSRLIHSAVHFGGCLTVNWHDRSIAPERLWDTQYGDMIDHLRRGGAWFSTAGEAVAWFRKRRSVVFSANFTGVRTVRASVPVSTYNNVPGLQLRVHNVRESETGIYDLIDYLDVPFDETGVSVAHSALGISV